jgi:Phage-related lysozyme (muraminidase)
MLSLSDRGRNYIKGKEELRLQSYLDIGKIWTIGWGNTTINGAPVTEGMIINLPVAEALFNGKMQEFLDFIEKCVRVPLNQNQIDALASFIYNIGKSGFLNSSLLTAINAKMIINEDLFTRWNKVRVNGALVPSNGLTTRRKEEYNLFVEK